MLQLQLRCPGLLCSGSGFPTLVHYALALAPLPWLGSVQFVGKQFRISCQLYLQVLILETIPQIYNFKNVHFLQKIRKYREILTIGERNDDLSIIGERYLRLSTIDFFPKILIKICFMDGRGRASSPRLYRSQLSIV